jgi:hypothetical protein
MDFFLGILVEIFLEPIVRLPGYLLLLIVLPSNDVKMDGSGVLLTGILFWIGVLALLVWYGY